MKYFLFSTIILAFFIAMKPKEPINQTLNLSGSFDNFQQVWQENTSDDIHRVAIEKKHRHYHFKFAVDSTTQNSIKISMFEGRNNKTELGVKSMEITKKNADLFLSINKQNPLKLLMNNEGFSTASGEIKLKGDTLYISHPDLVESNKVPYRFVKCRFFTGWLQYPVPNKKDSTYFQNNLLLHDQGGMAELKYPNAKYTAELTQLVYGQKIKLMKIAIYEMPLDSIGINSYSASYAWASPDTKRLGINLRRLVSGWTLVEKGYLNRNTLSK